MSYQRSLTISIVCLSLLLISELTLAAKIVDKNEAANIVTLDSEYAKGTRLEVFVGTQKIGLIESLGGYRAKIIYGKRAVDIGASIQIKPARKGTMRISYAPLPFLVIERNEEYEALTGEQLNDPSSTGYRVRLKIDYLKSRGVLIGAGVNLGYAEVGSYLRGIEIGASGILGLETLPEVLEMHVYGSFGLLFSLGELKWVRREGTYGDDIGRNSGFARLPVTFPVEIGGGLDWRVSNRTSIFVYGLYTKFFNWAHWVDSERDPDAEGNYTVMEDWIQYKARNLAGITIEMGIRINLFNLK